MTRFIRRRQRPQGSGTCDAGYHEGRRTKRSLVYRLRRRTDEVVRCARRYGPPAVRSILDVGTADGLMLSRLADTFPGARCVGLDLSRELLVQNRDPRVIPVLADAQTLPIRSEQIDLAVATAVIEHVPEPLRLLREIAASLRPGGLLVLTAPDPFWEHVATLVGHLADEQHHEVLPLRRLAELCSAAGLQVVEASKFMLSPVGLPAELLVESLVRRLGLNALFANQLVAARRP
ncbi:MAG: class I SAM-dependent methyltransferase [bacterium]